MTSDPSIYDNPNVLIGDNGIPSQNYSPDAIKRDTEIPTENYNPIALKSIFKNLPDDNQPGKKGVKLFKEWSKSSQCNRWTEDLNHLNRLEPKEIILLYEQLPKMILGEISNIDSPKYKAFQHQQNYYNATSVWMMYWNSNFIFPAILEKSPYIEYEKDSNVLKSELNLCKMFLRYDSTGLKDLFAPFSLWLCMEYAKAIKKFSDSGLTELLPIDKLKTKNTIHNEAKNYIDLLVGKEQFKPSEANYLRSINDLFHRLPDWIIWQCKQLAENAKINEKDKELNPEKTFDEYIKSQKAFQNLNINPAGTSRHSIQVYQPENSDPKIYITQTKPPKPPKSKPRKAKRRFKDC